MAYCTIFIQELRLSLVSYGTIGDVQAFNSMTNGGIDHVRSAARQLKIECERPKGEVSRCNKLKISTKIIYQKESENLQVKYSYL